MKQVRSLIGVFVVGLLVACGTGSGRRGHGGPGPGSSGDDLRMPLADGDGGATPDGGAAQDGGGGDDLAGGGVPQLIGTLDVRPAYVYPTFVFGGSGGAGAGGAFSCVNEGDCQACTTGLIVPADMTPADLPPPDLAKPLPDLLPVDLLPVDLATSPDLAPSPDMATYAPNAGTLHVTGTQPSVDFPPALDGTYGFKLGPISWDAGATIRVESDGSTWMAPFVLEVAAPEIITLQSAPPVITRSSDYPITWASSPGVIHAQISSAYYLGYATGTITCSFDRSKGKGVVPKKLLNLLGPTADQYNVSVSFLAGNSATVTQPNAKMTLMVSTGAKRPAGQTEPFTIE